MSDNITLGDELDEIVYEDDYRYILQARPRLAAWLERAVKANMTPEQIRSAYLRSAGSGYRARERAQIVENASRYLQVTDERK